MAHMLKQNQKYLVWTPGNWNRKFRNYGGNPKVEFTFGENHWNNQQEVIELIRNDFPDATGIVLNYDDSSSNDPGKIWLQIAYWDYWTKSFSKEERLLAKIKVGEDLRICFPKNLVLLSEISNERRSDTIPL